jgi:hypothetical protein
MYWFKAHSLCEKCSAKQGLKLSSGFRKSLLSLLNQENIKLSRNDLDTWQQLIQDVALPHNH